ncbi:MAG: PT domain-containing protein [Gammaproteobacteria bacterium]|nr:PT domain-containing protein [Gammaproteobacteria bacterium]
MIATADPYGSASIKLFIVFGNRYQSNSPTLLPSAHPSYFPSSVPTISPTGLPSYGPTSIPSASPTALPSYFPSICPSYVPSYVPSLIPTLVPSALPSWPPTFIPTLSPTVCPTVFPSYGPTVNPTYTPTTRSPTSVRIGSRSVTIELPNDSFDLRSMTYNEYADAIIITTKTSVFYARQSALGYIQGSSLTVTMETDRSNLFAITAGKHTYFTDQSSSTIFCIVEYDEMTQNYGSKCLTNYRPLISGTLVKGEYFAITESGPTSFFKTHLIRSESLTFLRTLQYIVTGATPTVSASCGDSFPSACLYQAGYNPNDMVILQVPDISQETFAGLGGFLSVIKRTEAEINLQYQPYRLSITPSGAVLVLAKIISQGEILRYQCFKLRQENQKLAQAEWAKETNAELGDMISYGNDITLLCANINGFIGAPSKQLVIIALNETSGKLISATRVISLFSTDGACQFTMAGTRGPVFCVTTMPSTTKRAVLCGFIRVTPSGIDIFSLPLDVQSVPVSNSGILSFSNVTLTITTKAVPLNVMTTGYALYPSSTSTQDMSILSNAYLFAETNPSMSPTITPSMEPTSRPSKQPTIHAIVQPNVPPKPITNSLANSEANKNQ